MEAVAACLLNATNATNATVVPEEPSDMYELLQRQCRVAPGSEFKNGYGTSRAMLFIALAVPTVLVFGEDLKRIAGWAFERSAALTSAFLLVSYAASARFLTREPWKLGLPRR